MGNRGEQRDENEGGREVSVSSESETAWLRCDTEAEETTATHARGGCGGSFDGGGGAAGRAAAVRPGGGGRLAAATTVAATAAAAGGRSGACQRCPRAMGRIRGGRAVGRGGRQAHEGGEGFTSAGRQRATTTRHSMREHHRPLQSGARNDRHGRGTAHCRRRDRGAGFRLGLRRTGRRLWADVVGAVATDVRHRAAAPHTAPPRILRRRCPIRSRCPCQPAAAPGLFGGGAAQPVASADAQTGGAVDVPGGREMQLRRETVALAISYLDRFLSLEPIRKHCLFHLSAACLLIAGKLMERSPVGSVCGTSVAAILARELG
eukprot:ctg_1258.g288